MIFQCYVSLLEDIGFEIHPSLTYHLDQWIARYVPTRHVM